MIKYSIPKLSDQGKEILEALCDIQLKAYMKLSSKDNLENFKDYEILFENFEIKTQNIHTLVLQRMTYYANLRKNPVMLNMISDSQLAVLRHILYQMEEYWIMDNPDGIGEIWSIFFTLEGYRNDTINKSLELLSECNEEKE